MAGVQERRGKKLRVLVLGLDGLYIDLFRNKLSSYPGFRSMTRGNTLMVLNRAFKPVIPLTYPSWVSIETGMRPSQHGVPDFFTPDGKLLDASMLSVPRVYEAAALAGRRVLVLNPVPSYPLPVPQRVEVLAYDMFAPRIGFRGEITRWMAERLPKNQNLVQGCDARLMGEASRVYREALVKARDYDLVWLTMSYPDHLLHRCPRAHTETVAGEREILENIGALIEEGLGENFDVVIIVSDHGFRLYRRVVNVNVALEQAGLAKFTSDPRRAPPFYSIVTWRRIVRVDPKIVRLIRMLHLEGVARRLRDYVEAVMGKRVAIRQSLYPDWYASKALMVNNPYGVILRDESVAEKAIRVLSELPGVRWVERRESFDPGPYTARYPHIIILPDFDAGYTLSRGTGGSVVEETLESNHHPDGVMIIHPLDVLVEAGFEPHTGVKRVTPPVVGAIVYALLGLPVQKGVVRRAAEKLLGVRLGEADYTGRWRLARRVAARLARGAA